MECLLDQQIDFELCLLVLTNVGKKGLTMVVAIANQENRELANKILDALSRTEIVIQSVVRPALLRDLHESSNKSHKEKELILAAINRMAGMFAD